MTISRPAIIQEALNWIDTPYQHQMSRKGEGCDCLGLIRGIWRTFYGEEPIAMPPYTPDWAEKHGQETLKMACDQCLEPIALKQVLPADVLLFRMWPGSPAKHMAILIEPNLIVHAYWGRAVTRSFLAPFWKKRCAYAYRFPKLKDPYE